MVPSDVRQSDLANTHIKRGIIIKSHLIPFYSKKLIARHYLRIRRCVYELKIYLLLESDVQWELHNNNSTTDTPELFPHNLTI